MTPARTPASPDVEPHVEPAVVWLTGLSGAGKSTIARHLCARLDAAGARVECLDGDAIRRVSLNNGFGKEDRDTHVRFVAYMASRLEYHGVLVICALVSPYAEARAYARMLCRKFVEVYVSTPVEECQRRDVKGLYARARRGEVLHLSGVDDPYEPPESPELRIDTTCLSISDAADQVVGALGCRGGGHEATSGTLATSGQVQGFTPI